jgi:hypothetical protein
VLLLEHLDEIDGKSIKLEPFDDIKILKLP